MCGIYCSLSSRTHLLPSEAISERLRCRGPDSEHTLALETGKPPRKVVLCSTVLSLRGSQTTRQPFRDERSSLTLCWNGEAWSIGRATVTGQDTVAVYALLCEALAASDAARSALEGVGLVSAALSRVAGPYAFTLLDRARGHLYFGRDFLGRRSLCWRSTHEGNLIICSTTDGITSRDWREVEADGVYCIDLNALRNAHTSAEFLNNESSHRPAQIFHSHRAIGEARSVIPRLSLNRLIPTHTSPLTIGSPAVAHLHNCLRDSLGLRILDIPASPTSEDRTNQPRIAILFSGGLDCTVLARICHNLLPVTEPVDLLNVAFENPRIHSKLDGGREAAYDTCPDRITGRTSFAELQSVCHGRTFRFVAINVPYTETLQHRDTVISLMHPHNTEMDLSICCALYFAARGIGAITNTVAGAARQYTTQARVLLSGLGADELFGGYTRHGTAFKRAGYAGLTDELELDVSRLGQRNLGRDDRVISHSGKEARFPFLDEALLEWALNAPVTDKCGFGESVDADSTETATLDPEKKVLRCLAWKLGMKSVAKEKKRAIQFGARTAKMETGKTKGTTLLS